MGESIQEWTRWTLWKTALVYSLGPFLNTLSHICWGRKEKYEEVWKNFNYMFIHYIFIKDHISMILYLSILGYCTCFVCFIDLLRAEQWCLYHNGTDNANETTFSSLYTLLASILIWNNLWTYFFICYKFITALPTSSFVLQGHW